MTELSLHSLQFGTVAIVSMKSKFMISTHFYGENFSDYTIAHSEIQPTNYTQLKGQTKQKQRQNEIIKKTEAASFCITNNKNNSYIMSILIRRKLKIFRINGKTFENTIIGMQLRRWQQWPNIQGAYMWKLLCFFFLKKKNSTQLTPFMRRSVVIFMFHFHIKCT